MRLTHRQCLPSKSRSSYSTASTSRRSSSSIPFRPMREVSALCDGGEHGGHGQGTALDLLGGRAGRSERLPAGQLQRRPGQIVARSGVRDRPAGARVENGHAARFLLVRSKWAALAVLPSVLRHVRRQLQQLVCPLRRSRCGEAGVDGAGLHRLRRFAEQTHRAQERRVDPARIPVGGWHIDKPFADCYRELDAVRGADVFVSDGRDSGPVPSRGTTRQVCGSKPGRDSPA